ncbi:hypothetical protein LguiB_000007 [Lonicera macranthoides]
MAFIRGIDCVKLRKWLNIISCGYLVTVRDVASNVNNYAGVCFYVLLRKLLEDDRPVWTATSDVWNPSQLKTTGRCGLPLLISPCFKAILSFILVCICWEIWKQRNSCRIEGNTLNGKVMILNIKDNIRSMFHESKVLAKRPPQGFIKLNSDGCTKGNPSPSGGGSVLRNDVREIILAQCEYYGMQTNMASEARVLLQGVRRCIREG